MSTPKRSFSFLFIVLAFFSCGGDEDNDIKIPDKVCYPVKGTSPNLICIYNRNDKNEIVSIDYVSNSGSAYTGQSSVEYDMAGRITKIVNKNSHFIYGYNANGTVSSEKFYSNKPEPELLIEKSFTYNTDGQLLKVTSASEYFPDPEYERYEYKGDGNIIKIYYSKNGRGEVLLEEYLSFDDKKYGLLKQPFDHTTILMREGVADVMSRLRTRNWVNNPTVVKYNGTSINLSYTYNEYGYPVNVIERGTTYEYNCP